MTAERLATIETKVGAIERSAERQTAALEDVAKALQDLALQKARVDDHEKRLEAVDARVDSLERQAYRLAGMGVVLLFIVDHADKLLTFLK
ncbi:hypothetical protein [Burkholderia cepacia]|uniref:hypothetical protein n=1 Tax=Burkholderia cepacia TaxID=292 RepID=UPI000752EDD8|nr:hypothetical protein [Burkholderia cepacia]KWF99076.1 hypothetical protein WL95_00230 [Burkholderia cepacia]